MAAAVCPGAPFLIADPAPAPSLARRVPNLLAACRTAVRALAPADRLLVIAAAPGGGAGAMADGRLLPPGSALVGWGFVRGDNGHPVSTLPGAPGTPPAVLAAPGTAVGLALLARAGLGAPTWAWELGARREPARAPLGRPFDTGVDAGDDTGVDTGVGGPAGIDPAADVARWGLLVSADGSARHGDDAPGRSDVRAAAFDGALTAALAAGDPAGLERALSNPDLPAGELLAGCSALRLLARWSAPAPPRRATLHYAGAPFGVGYLVASWSWEPVGGSSAAGAVG